MFAVLRNLGQGGLTHALPTAARDRRRHPTGAIEPVRLPLAVADPLPGGRRSTSVHLLRGYRAGHRGPARRLRVMEAKDVELVGRHHRCRARPPYGSARDSPGTERRDTSHQRGAGDSDGTHHRAGSAALLTTCFGNCCPSTSFARKVRAEFPRWRTLGLRVNKGKAKGRDVTSPGSRLLLRRYRVVCPLFPSAASLRRLLRLPRGCP